MRIANKQLLAIQLAGVGGQGVLMTARILGEAAMLAEQKVMVGQLHGMSQRGGSVEASVIIGSACKAFIARGGADVVLGFEPLEAQRALPKMSDKTTVLLNSEAIVPFSLTQLGQGYPQMEVITKSLRDASRDLFIINGTACARETGQERVLGTVMLGALVSTALLPFDGRSLRAAIEKLCPPKHLAANLQAFELGKALLP